MSPIPLPEEITPLEQPLIDGELTRVAHILLKDKPHGEVIATLVTDYAMTVASATDLVVRMNKKDVIAADTIRTGVRFDLPDVGDIITFAGERLWLPLDKPDNEPLQRPAKDEVMITRCVPSAPGVCYIEAEFGGVTYGSDLDLDDDGISGIVKIVDDEAGIGGRPYDKAMGMKDQRSRQAFVPDFRDVSTQEMGDDDQLDGNSEAVNDALMLAPGAPGMVEQSAGGDSVSLTEQSPDFGREDIDRYAPDSNTYDIMDTSASRKLSRWERWAGESFELFDRYDALGMDPPDVKTMCNGQCEGTGWVPIYKNTENKQSEILGDEEDPVFSALWDEAEVESPAMDGWHFVECPECDGIGKKKDLHPADVFGSKHAVSVGDIGRLGSDEFKVISIEGGEVVIEWHVAGSGTEYTTLDELTDPGFVTWVDVIDPNQLKFDLDASKRSFTERQINRSKPSDQQGGSWWLVSAREGDSVKEYVVQSRLSEDITVKQASVETITGPFTNMQDAIDNSSDGKPTIMVSRNKQSFNNLTQPEYFTQDTSTVAPSRDGDNYMSSIEAEGEAFMPKIFEDQGMVNLVLEEAITFGVDVDDLKAQLMGDVDIETLRGIIDEVVNRLVNVGQSVSYDDNSFAISKLEDQEI